MKRVFGFKNAHLPLQMRDASKILLFPAHAKIHFILQPREMRAAGWVLFVLLFPEAVGVPGRGRCSLTAYHHQGFHRDGDRIIGGFMPLSRAPNLQEHHFKSPPELADRDLRYTTCFSY